MGQTEVYIGRVNGRDGFPTSPEAPGAAASQAVLQRLAIHTDARHWGLFLHGGSSVTELRRQIQFEAAYDKRDADPSKDYGIHGVTIRFAVSGDEGATQFLLYTNWQLPHVDEEWATRDIPESLRKPMPADLGYHSKKPSYNDHTPQKDCEWAGGDCYYDGSSLAADAVFKRLLIEGEEGVWAELEDFYAERLKPETVA